MNPVHTFPSYVPTIQSSYLHLCLLHGLFPTKIVYEFLIFPLCTTCPSHLIILDLITLTIFDELLSTPVYMILHRFITLQPTGWVLVNYLHFGACIIKLH